MDVAREAEPELHCDRRTVAHAVDGEAEQRHTRPPARDERFDGRLVGVILELAGRDLHSHDLLDALDVDDIDERCGI